MTRNGYEYLKKYFPKAIPNSYSNNGKTVTINKFFI